MTLSILIVRRMAALAVLGLLMVSAPLAVRAERPDAVLESLKDFLRAMYSRDSAEAYRLLSRADREEKSSDDYAMETGGFDGPALALARELAKAIRFENLQLVNEGGRATVIFDAVIPNANDPAIGDLVLGFEPGRLDDLTAAEIGARRAALRQLAADDRLPMLRSGKETWTLLREADGWRVFLNWAEAVEVRFEAVTIDGLDWHFTPLRDRVMARHGETIRMAYRAKNVGDRESTGKARHIVGPVEDAQFMEIVACFCFLEQTLAPGEEVELPLVFRVDYDAPGDVTNLSVRYEFYPADSFPPDQSSERTD